ncbi:hypothetical protein BGZ98_006930 [Dissophora globulifera]|nr:hypothetical protein BGZ98_006930 [Dissophora globulifera]
MATQFVNVASLVPDQHHCNLRLRVLSVEAIAETVHPETGKSVQSAEAIVGDDTACILLNLKNDQVNLLARNNARLEILNARVNMYRGFMRLEVNEDEDSGEDSDVDGRGRPSITAIMDEDEDDLDSQLSRDGNKVVVMAIDTSDMPATATANSILRDVQEEFSSASTSTTSAGVSTGQSSGATTTMAATSSSTLTATIASGSPSSNSLSSSSSSSTLSRDQLEMEMRLGTGGSVPLVEYYRTIEFAYFSTVEPVGR